MPERKMKKRIDVAEALVTVTVNNVTRTFVIADISFDQSRKEAALGIGGAIIDSIYNATEGKRAEK